MNQLKIVSTNMTCESDRSSTQSVSKKYQQSQKTSKSRNFSKGKNIGNTETLDLCTESPRKGFDRKDGLLAGSDMSIQTVQDMVEMTADSLYEEAGFDEKEDQIGENCACGGFKFLSMLKAWNNESTVIDRNILYVGEESDSDFIDAYWYYEFESSIKQHEFSHSVSENIRREREGREKRGRGIEGCVRLAGSQGNRGKHKKKKREFVIPDKQ